MRARHPFVRLYFIMAVGQCKRLGDNAHILAMQDTSNVSFESEKRCVTQVIDELPYHFARSDWFLKDHPRYNDQVSSS